MGEETALHLQCGVGDMGEETALHLQCGVGDMGEETALHLQCGVGDMGRDVGKASHQLLPYSYICPILPAPFNSCHTFLGTMLPRLSVLRIQYTLAGEAGRRGGGGGGGSPAMPPSS